MKLGLIAIVFVMVILIIPLSDVYGDTVSVRVSASSDDAGEAGNGSVILINKTIKLGFNNDDPAGFRFNGLTIPQGATINSADIQFTANGNDADATSLTIFGEDADNAVTFTTATNNISSRTQTTASVAWNSLPSWTDNAAGTAQKTSDLKTIVQEIVDRSGWSSGNSMSFIITGTGKRTVDTYDESSSTAALLSITYSIAPDAPTGLAATVGNTQISLTWSAPSDNGAAITDYIIEYRTGSDSFAAFSDGTSTATSATVTGLTNGVSYDFQVKAVNSVGTGSASSSVSSTPAAVAPEPVLYSMI